MGEGGRRTTEKAVREAQIDMPDIKSDYPSVRWSSLQKGYENIKLVFDQILHLRNLHF